MDIQDQDRASVIVVGNGPSVLGHKVGDQIDAFDRVVRINGYVTAGLTRYVGNKTTDWACSAVVSRRDAGAYDRIYLCGPTPYWIDACMNRLDEWYPNAVMLGLDNVARIKPYARGWPSTGLMVIEQLLQEHEAITIHGFDGLVPGIQEHYFDPKLAGDSAHDPESERGYIQRHVDAGRLRWLVAAPTLAESGAGSILATDEAVYQRREICASCPYARRVNDRRVQCAMGHSYEVDLTTGRCRMSKWPQD